jgi:hypothetical protein
MCWSSSASIAATAVGSVATAYAIKKRYPKAQVFTLTFFTGMELLQALSYIWIGQCDVGGNQLQTYLSFGHITLQPTVISAFMLSFLNKENRKKWFKPAMGIALACSTVLFSKMFIPMVWEVPQQFMCKLGDSMCGLDVCTYRGDWHQAWRLPLMGVIPLNILYSLPVFILPIFYGSWRTSLYHFMLGPMLASASTTDPNESPAIWCLFSIALLCSIFFKPVRKVLQFEIDSEK